MQDKVFKAHPHLERYYKTSDGQEFFQNQDARNHAKGLKDKAIETVEKSAQLPVDFEEVKATKQEAKATAETSKPAKAKPNTTKTGKSAAKAETSKETGKTGTQEPEKADQAPKANDALANTNEGSGQKETPAENEADNKQ